MVDAHTDEKTSEDKINSIIISNFKSSKLSHIDKKQRQEEVEKMRKNGYDDPGSPQKFDAIRLPNKSQS